MNGLAEVARVHRGFARAAFRTGIAAAQGHTEMPGAIRGRCGQESQPWRGGFDRACIIAAATLLPQAASAEARATLRPVTAYIDAVITLERHEIAALALSLGIILFAVATAIALLRKW